MSPQQPDELRPDYAESVKFLRAWQPGGPWHVVAIAPDRKGVDVGTFNDLEPQHLLDFLDDQGTRAKRNVYFVVNPCDSLSDSPPQREQMTGLAWLHIDLDPRPGEDIDEERTRILAKLRDPTGGIPAPTCITFSGGGYQGFWRLDRTTLLNRSSEQYEDAKLFNKQLEIVLGGDNCHNVNRIMRLPGTINRPDKRKRAKGRTEVLAQLIEWHEDRAFDLDQFEKTEAKPVSATGGGVAYEPPTSVRRFGSVDDIPELADAPQCRVVIVQGNDPDDPDKFDGSRSEWLFFACCEMVRQGMSDDDIYSVITDPSFAVSDSVIDKGSGVESYAIRQIERARERAIASELMELNDEYAFVEEVGGRARIMSFYRDPILDQDEVVFTLPTGFKLAKNNQQVEVGTDKKGNAVTAPLGDWWIKHPRRRSYDRIVFAPGRDLPPSTYNLWQGFGVDPEPGECGLFLEHLRANVCRGVADHFEYLLRWMANAVQNPGRQGHVAIVLRGPKGVGKSFFATQFGKLWGRHFKHITNPDHLVGKFNAMLMDGALVFADEAFYAGNARHAQALKTLITEDRITVELKGLDMKNWPNCTKLIMASNEDWIVRATKDERRFFVLDVGADRMQDRAYFSRIVEELECGGYGALLHTLLGLDLSGFDVTTVPKTEALREQVSLTLTSEPRAEWLLTLLMDGELPNRVPGEPRAAYSTETERGAQNGLYDHARRVVPDLRHKSDTYLSRGPGILGAANVKPNGAGRFWRFPPLARARAAYEERYGAQDWSGDPRGRLGGRLAHRRRRDRQGDIRLTSLVFCAPSCCSLVFCASPTRAGSRMVSSLVSRVPSSDRQFLLAAGGAYRVLFPLLFSLQ